MDEAKVEASAQSVQEILISRKIHQPGLPPLHITQEKKPDLFDQFMQWLQSFFPKWNLPSNPDLARHVVQIVVGVTIALVVIAVILWAWRLKFAKVTSDPTYQRPTVLDPEARLVEILAQAKASGHWAVAARLRWRLALLRKQLAPSATPQEVVRAHATDLNETMFKKDPVTEADYELSAKKLNAFEESAP